MAWGALRWALAVVAVTAAAVAAPTLWPHPAPATVVAPAAPAAFVTPVTPATAPVAATTAPAAPPVPPAWGLRPTAADPLRVLVLGDSIMYDAVPGIEAALESTGRAVVDGGAVLGFGLARGYDWRSEWRRLLLERRPHVVVLMFGTWDHDSALAQPPGWYEALVDEAADLLTTGGTKVVWVGMPETDRSWHVWAGPGHPPEHGEEGRRYVNGVYERRAAARPGVAYVDPATIFGGPGGGYEPFLADPDDGLPERARKTDGAHLCPAGAARMGAAVLRELGGRAALPAPAPAWADGPWRLDGRYFTNPPGECPVWAPTATT